MFWWDLFLLKLLLLDFCFTFSIRMYKFQPNYLREWFFLVDATAATVGDGDDEMKAFWCDACDSAGQPKAIYDRKKGLLNFHNVPIFFCDKISDFPRHGKNARICDVIPTPLHVFVLFTACVYNVHSVEKSHKRNKNVWCYVKLCIL